MQNAIVVGGGLAGLTAANYLANAGLNVRLLEKSKLLGGRGQTIRKHGFHMNLGPHALYMSNETVDVWRELGIEPDGAYVTFDAGMIAVRDGELYPLPVGPGSMLTSPVLTFTEKLAFTRFMVGVIRKKQEDYRHITVRDWVWGSVEQAAVREFILALFRLATYTNAPDDMSADQIIHQFRGFGQGLKYIHCGWQTIVDTLDAHTLKYGVEIETGYRVERVVIDNGVVKGVQMANREVLLADGVVLAVPPKVALSMVSGAENMVWGKYAAHAIPVNAAILDLALKRQPDPYRNFALGLDEPLYLSVHSHWATLAPENGAMIYAAKYLSPGEDDATGTRAQLESLTDILQPGWRDEVVEQRYLPSITVMNAMPTARNGGLAGRPAAAVDEVHGLALAGDWITPAGILVEPVAVSARDAARHIIDSAGAGV